MLPWLVAWGGNNVVGAHRGPASRQELVDIANSSIVSTMLSASVGIFLAQRVNSVAQESKAAEKARLKAEIEASRLDDALTPDEVLPPEEAGESSPSAPAPMTGAPPSSGTPTATQAPIASATDAESRRRFAKAAAAISKLKDYVDECAERVRDGRVRRKYNNISRRDYRVITSALRDDGGLPAQDADDLLQAFEKWRSFRNGRARVSEKTKSYFELAAERFAITADKPARWRPKREAS